VGLKTSTLSGWVGATAAERQIKRHLKPRVAGVGSIKADQQIFEGHAHPLVNDTPPTLKNT
jgi:hypothetical protein